MKRYNSEQDWLDTRPVCWGCGCPVRSSSVYAISGRYFCHDCEDDAKDALWEKLKYDYLEDIPEE